VCQQQDLAVRDRVVCHRTEAADLGESGSDEHCSLNAVAHF